MILGGYVAESPDDFKIAGEPFTAEPYGIGMAKGDDDFRAWINDTLEASFADGRWEAAWEATAGEVLPTPRAPDGRPLLIDPDVRPERSDSGVVPGGSEVAGPAAPAPTSTGADSPDH